MASVFEGVDNLPVWQRILAFVIFAVMIVAGWYFLFWTDAVEARSRAEVGRDKAKEKLDGLRKRKESFLQEQREHEARVAEYSANLEVLPMSASTIDNLMQTFQEKARLVELSVESWTHEAEERSGFYGRLPVKVSAVATWTQVAEFFRNIWELEQIVSIENLTMNMDTSSREEREPGDHPLLAIEFEVATYRMLSEDERTAAANSGSKRRGKKGSK